MTMSPAINKILLSASRRQHKLYSQFKETGVPWLSTVPANWQVKRLRYAVSYPTKAEVRGLPPDTAISFVPMEAVGEYGGLNLDRVQPIKTVLNGYTYFANNDVLVAKITPCFENGKGALATGLENGIGFGTTELHVLRAGSELFPQFLFYLTIGEHFRKLGTAEMYGAGGQKRVPERFLKDIRHPIPPFDEQRAIVTFLDRETAEIDDLIAKKKTLILGLVDKRKGTIAECTTKGLDRSKPMKDSKILWFGLIPKHWHVTRLGWICSEISDINHEMPPAVDDGVPFLSAKDLLDDGTLNFTRDVKMISEDDFRRLAKKSRPRHDDIIYSRIGACLGKARIVMADTRFLVSYSCCVIRLKTEVCDPAYFCHLLDTDIVLTEAKMRTQGIGVPDLGLHEIGRFPVPVPPIEEQRRIARFLDEETERLGSLVQTVEKGIAALQNYRASLIAAAVTGQIDVRSHRAEAPCL